VLVLRSWYLVLDDGYKEGAGFADAVINQRCARIFRRHLGPRTQNQEPGTYRGATARARNSRAASVPGSCDGARGPSWTARRRLSCRWSTNNRARTASSTRRRFARTRLTAPSAAWP